MSQDSFVHLHLHTQYSFLDGAIRVKDLFKKAQDLNMPAVAMTDHGNLCGAIDFYRQGIAAGIKPIIGCEVYITTGSRFDRKLNQGIRAIPGQNDDEARSYINHLILLAKNKTGYQNLCTLVTKAFMEGFYYKPRIDRELLTKHSEGLVALTACLKGEVAYRFHLGQEEKALEAIKYYQETFGDDLYLELQENGLREQLDVNQKIYSAAKEFGIQPVATADCHYLNKEDSVAQEVLLCIQTGKTFDDENRMRMSTDEFYFKSPQTIHDQFGWCPDAWKNTLDIADKCNLELKWVDDQGKTIYLLPEYPTPSIDDAIEKAKEFFNEDPDEVDLNKGTESESTEEKFEIEPEVDCCNTHHRDIDVESSGGQPLSDEQVLTGVVIEGKDGIANSQKMANELSKPSDQISVEEHLKNCAKEGLEVRFAEPWFDQFKSLEDWDVRKESYYKRLEIELDMIFKTGFSGYFLIVADFINWAKKNSISVGPGRGSGAGSIVAWSLRITDIDPIHYGLLFERFINLDRISMPDFDVDFCQERRGEVIGYVSEKYGRDKVCQIVSYGAMTAKSVIKDVGRVFNIPFKEANELTSLIPSKPGISLAEAFEIEPELTRLERSDARFKQIFKIARALEGLYRQPGMHAAGVIITDKPITEYAPLLMGKEGAPIIQYDKDFSETIGLVKFDFLGLKTLDVISMACDLVRRNHPEFDISSIDISDQNVFKMISDGDTSGVFQIESEGMTNIATRLGPTKIEEIFALVALYRPGPLGSGMVDDFIERKHGRTKIVYDLPELASILEETYGVIIYQEQVMEIARVLAGYTRGEADILRSIMGKKKVEKIPQQLEKFLKGAKEKNIPIDKAQKIFDLMKSFAEYGFNKSHSAAYAYITYQTAFLKKYFTPEYMAALLTTEMGDIEKVGEYIKDTRDHGIEVLPPDINESTRVFNVPLEDMDVNPRIRFGFGAIKGVGDAAIEFILEERNANGPFKDFVDFCCRVNLKKVNKKTIESLLKVGCFDNIEEHNRATLIASMEPVMEYASRRKDDIERGQESLFGAIDGGRDSMGPTMNIEEAIPDIAKLEMEKELVGFYISGHPLDAFEEILPKFRSMSCKEATQVKAADFGGAVDSNMPFRRPKKSVILTGMISSYRTHINKAGKRMAFLKIEDLTGEIEGVIFSNVFEKTEGKLGTKDPVVIHADLELKGEKAQVIVQDIASLKNESRKKFNLVKINVPLRTFSPEKLSHLKSVLLKHRGACRISLTFSDAKGGNVQMGLPEAYSVSPSPSLAEEINQLIGNPSVEFLATRSKRENQLS